MMKSNLPVADFSVNPYVGCLHGCKYCYASFMKRFTNHPEPWGEFIDVKYWPEMKNAKRYAGKEAFFGSVTDCYQPHEAKYKRTRALLEQLQGSGIRYSPGFMSTTPNWTSSIMIYTRRKTAPTGCNSTCRCEPSARQRDYPMYAMTTPCAPVMASRLWSSIISSTKRL